MVANRFLYGIEVLYGSERINFDARRCNRSIVGKIGKFPYPRIPRGRTSLTDSTYYLYTGFFIFLFMS